MKNLISLIVVSILTVALYSQVRVEGSTGFTTIGGTTPATETLEVKGNALFGTQGMLSLRQQAGQTNIDHTGSQPMYIRTTGALPASIVLSTGMTNRFVVSKTGNLRFFNTNGELASKSGDAFWNVVSDANLKTNVQDYNEGLDALMKIRPVTFSYNTKLVGDPNKSHVGIIAQEVEKVAPYMVSESEFMHPEKVDETIGTYKSVNPNAFLFMLINGMQEQQELIENQKTLLDKLSAEVAALKSQTAGVKANSNQVNLKGNAISSLSQNIPNPFSTSTKIEYFVPSNTNDAKVVFTDMNGNTIKTINVEKGKGTIDVNVEGLSNGVYIYTLIVDGITQESKRMVVE